MSDVPEPVHHTIDYIEISVTDMARAQRFYGEAFGWSFTDYAPVYAGIQRPDGSECGGLSVVDEVRSGGPLVFLYSRELDATLDAVQRAGGTITVPNFEFPGGRRFEFQDPDGNGLGVWTRRV